MEFLKKLLCSSKFFIILSVVVLYLGYSLNLWKATDYERYYDYKYSFIRNLNLFGQENFSDSYLTFDRWSESLVLGRLVKTRKDGLLSSGGFVGWFVDFPEPPDTVEERFFKQAYQYVLYFDNSSDHQAKEFRPYRSQVGGQAFFLGILDKVIPGTNIFKLKSFYHLMAFMTSLIVFLIIFWFYNEFGIITGWFLTISFGLSCYITLYAKSIWWILWAFYIPFLLMLYSLRKEEISNLELSLKTIFLLTLVGMILKIFLNGYEFITPTVVMVSIPMFYYAIKNKWKIKVLFSRLCTIGGGIILAIIITFAILSIQFVIAGDSFYDGINYIFEAFLRRSHGGGTLDPNSYAQKGVDALLIPLLEYFLYSSPIFDFRKMGISIVLRMKYFLSCFLFMTILWAVYFRALKSSDNYCKMKSLIVTLWISVLGPISWFVIFKAHSYIHRNHDHIVWYMPFMFYGLALIGSSVQEIISRGFTFEN